jgi:hypothetical protein
MPPLAATAAAKPPRKRGAAGPPSSSAEIRADQCALVHCKAVGRFTNKDLKNPGTNVLGFWKDLNLLYGQGHHQT